jgi:F0F1-type ATP synthase membrane subunit a
MQSQIMDIVVTILGTIVTGVIAIVGAQLQAYLAAKAEDKRLQVYKKSAETVVTFINQVLKDASNDEKLQTAIIAFKEGVGEKTGLSDAQIAILIEQAVSEINLWAK